MRFLVCNTEVNPCPVADQAWISLAELLDVTALGITPETILKAFAWGFGAVWTAFLLGYVLSVALGLIRKV